jgi:Domain of unknown function (DUF4382)
MNILRHASWALLAAALSLAACGGGGGGIGGTGSAEGTLRLAITDAPACGYDAVNITIEKLRVHQSAGAGDGDAGWSEIVLAPARRIDLLELRNGVLEELGQTSLPAGRYTQLRLVLAANGATAPFANSVVPSGGSEAALSTPSAQQSGIKLNVDIEVAAGQVADFVLDFDACRSVVRAGNSGRYNLKPVISVIPRLADAGMRVLGHVDRSVATSATHVSLQSGGVPVKTTTPDANGSFVLYPVPLGSYDLVLTAAGRVTAVMTGVPVIAGAPTVVSSSGVPITPPLDAAAPRPVSGNVSASSATVRALQFLTGGPTVEVAWGAVDESSGAFQFALPPGAPVRTAYVANPTTLSFTADAAAAGRYTIEAASGSATRQQAIDVTAPVPPISFSFP